MRTPERQSAGASAAGSGGQGRPQGGRPGRPRQGRRGRSRPPGSRARPGPRQGSRAPTGAQQQGRNPSAPLRIASGGPQQGGKGDRAGRAAQPLTGPLRRRRRSAGNRKPPPGQGQGQGPQGGAVGAGVSPARSAGPSHRRGAAACRGRPG